MRSRSHLAAALSLSLIAAGATSAYAQAPAQANAQAPPTIGWSSSTDLSLVVTGGNSDSTTLGFATQLRRVWANARFEFDVTAVRAYKSDDRYFKVDPGLEFPVGGAPSNPPTALVKPEPTLDVGNYLIQSVYERNVSRRWFWNVGGSWYRNDDAGILNRYIAYAGLGTNWVDNQRRRFATTYGLSFIDREEEEPDPEKDRRFAGARLGFDYTERFNATTTFDSDFTLNANLSDSADYSINTLNALTVSMNDHISIKVSIQWLYENEPALETDLDVIAYVQVLNPDGAAGTGDERFQTLDSGGTKLVLGSSDARKGKLDTVVRTALVIKF